MACLAGFKQSQHLKAWQGCLQARALQIFWLVYGGIFQDVINSGWSISFMGLCLRDEDYDNCHRMAKTGEKKVWPRKISCKLE